mmetsp:Transcript_89253/g.266225  ORF Transcript_89253/g.266225 Transcript_89253/m.266225 type:complete len:332 (-) Transcript_89253:118-1113(-)
MVGQAPMADAVPMEDCCAICFEQRPFISLPCACQVNYCAVCWDRALASSVTVRGRAQCPSCRTAFRIDFDPEMGGLVFMKDMDGTAAAGGWKSRLYGKARPVQINLLKSFGTSLVSRTAGDPSSDDATECDGEPPPAGAGPQSYSRRPETGACDLPVCVCGAHLERVSSRDRILRMLEDTDASWRTRVPEVNSLINRLFASSLVTCDICNQNATRSGALWTCKNGTRTVLHPASYDVCESCFVRYAGSHAEGFLRGRILTRTSSQDSAGYCNCAAAVCSTFTCWHWRRRTPVLPASRSGGEATRRPRCFVESLLFGMRYARDHTLPSTHDR